MRRYWTIANALFLLAACQKSDTLPEAAPSATAALAAPSAAAIAAASATPSPGSARSVEEENELFAFDYNYPVEAGVIPTLRAVLDADIARQRDELAKQAREGRDEAKKGSFAFQRHDRSVGWKVVADLPGWLSLSADVGGYSGGAHPNHGYDAMVWDKAAAQRLKASDMFLSPQALSRAIRADFCREIDKQRASRRGSPVNRKSGDPFDECIDPLESTVILGSSNRKAFDRIGILVAPYEAGPYAEGDYEVTLPVTASVLAAVKPQYQPTFVIKK
jgi:hypothetical protein